MALYDYDKKEWHTYHYFDEKVLKVISDIFGYIKKYTIDYMEFKYIDDEDEDDNMDLDDFNIEDENFMRRMLIVDIDAQNVVEEMLEILNINI
jgi:hypothetical protein